MIIQHLKETAFKMRYDNFIPAFLFDMQSMENLTADKEWKWFILIPVVQDRFVFDRFDSRQYNLPVTFAVINPGTREINEDSTYYDTIFNKLIEVQKSFLLNIDQVKDEENRRMITIRDEQIITNYQAQDTFFDVPCTTLSFNLPITYSPYESLCP